MLMEKKITDETPIAMLTVGDLKKLLGIDRIIGQLKEPIPPPSEVMMDVKAVARLTGYSEATIYKYTSERKIPFHKPEHGGRKLYFNREEILDWMQCHATPTIEQETTTKFNSLLKQ